MLHDKSTDASETRCETYEFPVKLPSLPDDKEGMTAKLPDGVYPYRNGYCFRAYVKTRDGTKQIRKSGFTTPEAASSARMEFLVGTRNGTMAAPTSLRVGEWLDFWLEAGKSTWESTTHESHTEVVNNRLRPHLGHLKLQTLTEVDIRRAYDKLALKYTTESIKGAHRRLRTALRMAVRERKISFSPAENVTPPKGQPADPRKVWSFDELVKFADFVSTQRDSAMWVFWITTGLRRGELCGLKWEHVNLEQRQVLIHEQRTVTVSGKVVEKATKTESGVRVLTLTPKAVTALRAWKAIQSEIRLRQGSEWRGKDYVFTTMRNKPYFPGSFGARLESLAKKAGVTVISPHELRHTFGTRAHESGMDIKLLSRMMGHANTNVTYDLYVHPNQEQIESAADAFEKRMFG